MDDDQHLEGLHMDNDFEGGEWIGGEFFYKRKKQKRHQTAEDRIYGVFAADSDEEETGTRRGGGGRRGKADFSKPVAFVSTGETVRPEEPQSAESRSAREGAGASDLAGLGAGLGFAASQAPPQSEASRGASEGEAEEDDDAADVLPTAFGRRVKQAAEERKRQAKAESTAKLRQSEAKSGKLAGGIGTFEQHTKGIGAKLLSKMGYVPGKGLGRNKQGIAKPIEAQMRPKGMGMGFGDFKESKAAPKLPGAKAGPEEAPEEGPQKPKAKETGFWKKRNAEARRRREYKTAEEVLQASEKAPADGGAQSLQQPILDMRGPQARLVANMESLDMKEHHEDGDSIPMPELQHNLRLIVDLAEAEISRIDAKLRHEKDTAVVLGREQSRQEAELQEADEELERISHIMQEMERASATSDLGGVREIFDRVRRQFPEQYIMYNIPAAALAQVLPLLKAQLGRLQPLEEPQRGLDEFLSWRPILEGDRVKDAVFADAAAEDDPYCCLFAEVVMPHIRSAVTNVWQPRDPEPLLRWLESWDPALPPPTRDYILIHLVLPALQRAVESWEPRQETVAIHSWLHPWLPWLGPQLRPLYQPLRFKLSRALEEWHPSDGSALALLAPWQKVFDQADWEALLLRSILPKLTFALDQLVINPTAQDMAPFSWFTAWSDALPAKFTAQLLERSFFPKFLQVLDHWLLTSPNYDEITRWYLSWKAAVPSAVLDHERVRKGLNAALDLMNRRMAGDTAPFAFVPSAGQWTEAAYGAGAAAGGTAPYAPPAPAAVPLGLRELLQSFAEQNGITFLPKPGRYWQGHQVYSFGGVSVVAEAAAGVLRAQVGDRWTPMSMEGLLQEMHRRASA